MKITHHDRLPGHLNRWHVHIEGRQHPILVELPPEERDRLELTDEEIHELLPTALQRRAADNRDDVLDESADDVSWDTPVRVYQTHFMG